ncbi:recombinase family protein, partial [Dehalococcoidia bacterium]|nr:recombinase family protein [Dehalococcoidia bacterium]
CLVNLVNEEMDSVSRSHQDELSLILNEIGDVNSRLERLYDAIETGTVELDDLAPRIRQLRIRQEQLQDRRTEIENMLSERRVELADLKTVRHYANDLHNLLSESPLTERRAFIRSFVKEVKVTGDEALLTYNHAPAPGRYNQ